MAKRKLVVGFVLWASVVLAGSEITFTSERTAPSPDDYNFHVRNLSLDLSTSARVAYTDNANRAVRGSEAQVSYSEPTRAPGPASEAKQDSTKATFTLGAGLYWPVSPWLSLKTGLAANYVAVLSGEDESGLFVSGIGAGTAADLALQLNFDAGSDPQQARILTIRDQLSHFLGVVAAGNQIVPYASTVDGSSQKRYVPNEVQPNRLWDNVLSLQYESPLSNYLHGALKGSVHSVRAAPAVFDYMNRNEYGIEGVALAAVRSDLNVGPYARYVKTVYDKDTCYGGAPGHPDANTYEFGLRADWKAMETLQVKSSVGWNIMSFDERKRVLYNGVVYTPADTYSWGLADPDDDDASSLVGQINILHTLSERFNHNLTLSYENAVTETAESNYTRTAAVSYGASWTFIENWALEGMAGVAHSVASGPADNRYVILSESVRVRHDFSKRIHAAVEYGREDKIWSSPKDKRFAVNMVALSVTYDF